MKKNLILALLSALLLLACNTQNEDLAYFQLPPELLGKLAAADVLDGKEDKVIEKCASCALMMPGKPEFGMELSEYQLHFCSQACQASYAKDATGRLTTLKVPELPKAPSEMPAEMAPAVPAVPAAPAEGVKEKY